MNRASLYRQLGGRHWKYGIIDHLKTNIPQTKNYSMQLL